MSRAQFIYETPETDTQDSITLHIAADYYAAKSTQDDGDEFEILKATLDDGTAFTGDLDEADVLDQFLDSIRC